MTDATATTSSAIGALPAEWTDRYVRLLGVEREAPGWDALARLARAHLLSVPFESVTSVLRRRAHPDGAVPPLDPAALLTAWEERRAGALCFDAAEMVSRLLAELGYRAYPTAGRIGWPGSHQAVVAELDGGRAMVDVGNGAPFFEPIPLDGE
ncbi:MAG: arylamine N-acetyltransferase [Chloroflexota bacterium]|nr:arylamine N-acetyltransferase [Chloroflexota bacterium]